MAHARVCRWLDQSPDIETKRRRLISRPERLNDAIDRVTHDVNVFNTHVRLLAATVVVHVLRPATTSIRGYGIRRRPCVDDDIRRRSAIDGRSTSAAIDTCRQGATGRGIFDVKVRREDCLNDLFVLDAAGLFETGQRLSAACDGAVVGPMKVRQGWNASLGPVLGRILESGVADAGGDGQVGWVCGTELRDGEGGRGRRELQIS